MNHCGQQHLQDGAVPVQIGLRVWAPQEVKHKVSSQEWSVIQPPLFLKAFCFGAAWMRFFKNVLILFFDVQRIPWILENSGAPQKPPEHLISNPRICASCRENHDGIYRCLEDEVRTSLEIWPPTFRVGGAISTILKENIKRWVIFQLANGSLLEGSINNPHPESPTTILIWFPKHHYFSWGFYHHPKVLGSIFEMVACQLQQRNWSVPGRCFTWIRIIHSLKLT